MVRKSYRVVGPAIAVSAAFLLLVPRVAGAQQPSAAKEAFEAANAEYALGHYTQALAKFELAFTLKQVPGLLFNIAQCHRQLKQFELAATTYRSFIRASPDGKQAAVARQLLEQVEETLKSEVAAQTRPPTNLGHETGEGRDGDLEEPAEKKSRSAGEAAPHAVAAVGSRQSSTNALPPVVSLQPHALGLQQPALEQHAVPVELRPRRATWVAAGATVVAFGAAGAFGLQAHSTNSSITGTQHPRAELDQLNSNLKSQASRANLLLGVGLGLAAVTAALFIFRF